MNARWKMMLASGAAAVALMAWAPTVTPAAAANGCYAHAGCSHGRYAGGYRHPGYGYRHPGYAYGSGYGYGPGYGYDPGPGPVVGGIIGGVAAGLFGAPAYYGPGPYDY